jgi:hypothetical protein
MTVYPPEPPSITTCDPAIKFVPKTSTVVRVVSGAADAGSMPVTLGPVTVKAPALPIQLPPGIRTQTP